MTQRTPISTRTDTLVPYSTLFQSNIVQQGCWDVIGTTPLRIMLKLNEQASMATLTFGNDNVLRINTVNDVTPTLEYRLTRQADIDAIDELAGKTPLKCD